MTLLDKLERHIGFIAIPGLIRIVVTFNVLVFGLVLLTSPGADQPGFDSYLTLNMARVRAGEVWRLVTYIFVPQTQHFLFVAMALWFLWFIGERLEQAWGAFRLTIYVLIGMIGTTFAAIFGGSQFSSVMLFTTLFFAFAHFYPEEIIYVLFILPLKVKWLAWIYAAFLLMGFAANSASYRFGMIAAFSNYFLFFGPEAWQQFRHRNDVAARRKRFEVQSAQSETEPLHRCANCGATERSNPDLEFRVARDGEEYCLPHLPSAAPVAH